MIQDMAVFLITFIIGWGVFLVGERWWLNRRKGKQDDGQEQRDSLD
jgi:hypothetical protein